MLQQTTVATVLPYYERFLKAFPSLASLAGAAEEEVLARWSGLGYYRRAKLLHQGAKLLQEEFHGRLPTQAEDLQKIPGIGPYTAGAIASTGKIIPFPWYPIGIKICRAARCICAFPGRPGPSHVQEMPQVRT